MVIEIDTLVLAGFRHVDRHAIADGLRHELGRILSEQLPSHPRVVARLNVNVQIADRARPRQVGETVARGIGREMKR
jgi:hypothetical protein